MSFNPIEYLKEGKVDFVFNLTSYDSICLTKRIRERSDKETIIEGFLNHLKDKEPYFCFNVIYDIDKYKEISLYLLEKYKCKIDLEKLRNILYDTSWGSSYVLEHLESFILEMEEKYNLILEYIFSDFEKNKDYIEKLYLHANLHIRFLFMKALVLNAPDRVNEVYDDIMKYLTSYTHREFEQMTFLPELMSAEDISQLAVIYLKKLENKTMFEKLKEYILRNYDENNLARLLLTKKYNEEVNPLSIETFSNDSDILFETSHDFKFQIYEKYRELVSEKIIQHYLKYISYFKIRDNYDYSLIKIYTEGLGKTLEHYIDKYFSMSKDTTYNHIRSGSTSSCYRLGDYVFKLDRMKWSYEDIICPDLYLILPNLEETFIRDEEGTVLVGIEIQKYLSRGANNLRNDVYHFFREELKRLGYYTTDSLVNGCCGDNCMLLDSYKDAYCHDPEILPDIFKKYPMVLIDRDRVYKLENKHPKQLGHRF